MQASKKIVTASSTKHSEDPVDALVELKKTYWDQENNIFINKLNFVCKHFE